MTAARRHDGTTELGSERGWLRALRGSWSLTVCRLLDSGESSVVRVLVAEVRGSAPREAGTCMLVTHTETFGTIGGGNLEWQALQAARKFLTAPSPAACSVQVRRLVLGRELAQCCGGVVQLWIERFTPADLPFLRQIAQPGCDVTILTKVFAQSVVRNLLPSKAPGSTPRLSSAPDGQVTLLEPLEKARPELWLYGAGHVGQALVHIMGDLPFDITWVDCRDGLFPAPLPDNVRSICTRTPVNTINSAPSGALFLVVTHDHALDYEICRRILARGDYGWLGLIGSKSKGARFRSRLAREGLLPEQIARLTCPIGIEGVNSKLPAAIAVAVAAQLLRGVGVATEAAAFDERVPVVAARVPTAAERVPVVTERVPVVAERVPLTAPARANAGAPAAADATDPCDSADCATCSARASASRRTPS